MDYRRPTFGRNGCIIFDLNVTHLNIFWFLYLNLINVLYVDLWNHLVDYHHHGNDVLYFNYVVYGET